MLIMKDKSRSSEINEPVYDAHFKGSISYSAPPGTQYVVDIKVAAAPDF